MKYKRRYLFLVLILGVLTAGLAAGVQYRIRGSIKVVPGEDIKGAEPVFYGQKDIRWAEDMLGDSDYTMGSSGCLVTCIAMAMEMADIRIAGGSEENAGWTADPGEMNRYFGQNNVYDSQGNLQWEQLGALEPFQVDVSEEVSAELIQEYLRMGRYPIARVRVNGYGSFHYVLIVSSHDGVFYCMDPLNTDGEPVPLSEYHNRVYAVRCVCPGNQRLVLETEEAFFYEKIINDKLYITAVRKENLGEAAWDEEVYGASRIIDVSIPYEGFIQVQYQGIYENMAFVKEYDWQGKLESCEMPEKPTFIPEELIQETENIILAGEEEAKRYWEAEAAGYYQPDEALLEIAWEEIGMFPDLEEFSWRAGFYQVDFDNDGFEDIVVHLREGNGRMAMYGWYYLGNDGKGGYRKTEELPGCMSSGRFIEFNEKNYLIENQYDMIEGGARIFTGIGISCYVEGRLAECVFLSFEAEDRREVIYDESGGITDVRECTPAERNPVMHNIYTKYINTLFQRYYLF